MPPKEFLSKMYPDDENVSGPNAGNYIGGNNRRAERRLLKKVAQIILEEVK